MLFRSVRSYEYPPQKLDEIKIQLKKAAFSCFDNYKFFKELNLTKTEFSLLKKLKSQQDLIIQKSDKSNSVVILDKTDYIKKMEDLLTDTTKFEKINVDGGKEYNFMIKQEENVSKLLKTMLDKGSITENLYKDLKPVGSKPGILYGLAKTHKESVDGLPKFRPIISAINTPAYKVAKHLVTLVKDFTVNEYTLKDSFEFASIVDQKDHGCFMASLDVDALFTNVPLNETIDILISKLYKDSSIVNNIHKNDFKQLLCLATKESIFLFNGQFYRQTDGVAMGSPLGPTIANIFLCYHESVWLDECPLSYLPKFYKRYVDDIFVVFKSENDVLLFKSYLNGKHENISFSNEVEENNVLAFLDVSVHRDEHNKMSTGIYRKSSFSGVFSNFFSYIPISYKRGLVMTLIYRCFNLASNYHTFHLEVIKLTTILRKNAYPLHFIEDCVRAFLNKKYEKLPIITTVPRKDVHIVLPYLGRYSMIIRRNLQSLFKQHLCHCKLNIVFKTSTRVSHYFRFKDKYPSVLKSNIVYKYTCRNCNISYIGKSLRHTIARFSEHLGLSARTGKPVRGTLVTPVREHALYCDSKPSFDDFEIIGTQSNGNNFLLELKESIFIYHYGPKLNNNTTSRPLLLFV